jgi:hypothetical protein
MQVSNIEATVSNEISNEVLIGSAAETSCALQFTELQCVGGGSACAW